MLNLFKMHAWVNSYSRLGIGTSSTSNGLGWSESTPIDLIRGKHLWFMVSYRNMVVLKQGIISPRSKTHLGPECLNRSWVGHQFHGWSRTYLEAKSSVNQFKDIRHSTCGFYWIAHWLLGVCPLQQLPKRVCIAIFAWVPLEAPQTCIWSTWISTVFFPLISPRFSTSFDLALTRSSQAPRMCDAKLKCPQHSPHKDMGAEAKDRGLRT
jgi:hypothetical protein